MAKKGASRTTWMRQAEAARLLGVARSSVAWRVLKGHYRSKESHGLVLVSREDVEKDAAARQAAAA